MSAQKYQESVLTACARTRKEVLLALVKKDTGLMMTRRSAYVRKSFLKSRFSFSSSLQKCFQNDQFSYDKNVDRSENFSSFPFKNHAGNVRR